MECVICLICVLHWKSNSMQMKQTEETDWTMFTVCMRMHVIYALKWRGARFWYTHAIYHREAVSLLNFVVHWAHMLVYSKRLITTNLDLWQKIWKFQLILCWIEPNRSFIPKLCHTRQTRIARVMFFRWHTERKQDKREKEKEKER